MQDLNEERTQTITPNAHQAIANNIQKHGWHCVSVERGAQCPQYSYSIGLSDYGDEHELAVMGLMPHIAHGVMHSLVERVHYREKLELDTPITGIIEGYDVILTSVHDDVARRYFTTAFEYNTSPSFLKIVWPDAAGRFPGDPRMDPSMCNLQMIPSGHHHRPSSVLSQMRYIH